MNAKVGLNYISIPARYQATGVTRFDGNPFIEALPKLEDSKNAIMDRLENYPPEPTNSDRKKSELVRLAELGAVNEIVFGFTEYKRAATSMTLNIRETYVARNPLAAEDMARRVAIATRGAGRLPLPKNWVSTAKGNSLLGISGSGKTTLVNAFSLPYQVVIEHTEYKGKPLICRQIPWVNLRMSHDATLRSLCLQFFRVVDTILGNTDFARKARGVGGIAEMVDEMVRVGTVASIGHIFIDELQNLKAAKNKNAVFVLNLFSELLERAGMSLTIAGTPAIEDVIDENVRNLRKLNSGGEVSFGPMRFGDQEFDAFCDTYWEYQYVKNKKPLTKNIRRAWYNAGAGSPAFTALAFILANRNEIGGREVLDELAFERVSKVDMAILEPAIVALRSGDPKLLRNFDDLLFKTGTAWLRKLVAWNEGEESIKKLADDRMEFPEIADTASENADKKSKSRSRSAKGKETEVVHTTLPTENPLLR